MILQSQTRLQLVRIVFAVGLLTALSPMLPAEDWPQWRGPNRDGTWNETGLVEKFASDRLPIKWRAEISSGYSGPTVAQGRVYVTDRVARPESLERVHCFDEQSGQPIWRHEYAADYGRVQYPAGPRAAVTIDSGRAYALGSTGRLHCYDAADGRIVWNRDLDQDFEIDLPNWGISAAPLIYEDLVILHIGGRGACIVAVNKHDGTDAWKALNDRAQYSAPVLVQQAGRPVVICWTGDSVSGLAPATGDALWRYEWKPKRMPIGVASPVVHGDRVFCTSFYDGSLMLRLASDGPAPGKPSVEKLWLRVGTNENPPNTDALQSIIATPVFDGTHIYGVDSYGELRCLDAATGDRLWEDLTAVPKDRWSTIHFVKNGDRYFLFTERGELIIARLAPDKFHEISRTKLIDPTTEQLRRRGGVCWAHPAFANRHIFQRNDNELVCASLEGQR